MLMGKKGGVNPDMIAALRAGGFLMLMGKEGNVKTSERSRN